MLLKRGLRRFFTYIKKIEEWSIEPEKASLYAESHAEKGPPLQLFSVWDILRFKENTQAYHLNSVMGFEEWIDMEEVLRRVRDLFGAEYKNLRSLYPYLKTLVDIGLVETTNAGGRRKWRKVALLVPPPKEGEEKEKIQVAVKKKQRKED